MDWFLYDRNLHHERVNPHLITNFVTKLLLNSFFKAQNSIKTLYNYFFYVTFPHKDD